MTVHAAESPASRIRSGMGEVREIGAEFGSIATDIKALAGAEASLARAEVRENVAMAVRGIVWGAIGAAFTVLALIWVAVSLTVALDLMMPLWAAALVTLGVLALAATIAGMTAIRHFRRTKAVPEKTMTAIREDIRWAKDQLNWRPTLTAGDAPSSRTSTNSSAGSTMT